jgi:hypothetical protein
MTWLWEHSAPLYFITAVIAVPFRDTNPEAASPNIIWRINSGRMSWLGYTVRIAGMRNTYKIFVGKSEGNTPLARPRRVWEDNIRTDIREIVCECVDWIHLAQDRDQWRAVVNTVMKLCTINGGRISRLAEWLLDSEVLTMLHAVNYLVNQSLQLEVTYLIRSYISRYT